VSQTIGSLEKALVLIDELARARGDVGVTELAHRLSLSKNQVFRILATLKEYNYVHQTPAKTYRLGSKFFEIGQQMMNQSDLIQATRPLMDWLRDETGETIHLFARDELQAVCIERRESHAAIGLSAQVGRRFLMHAGACPKAILAFQDEAYIDRVVHEFGLPRYTEHTVTTREELEAQLREIRERGYAESDEDLDPYAYSIAVPLPGPTGRVNTAMSVAGPVHRFTLEHRERAFDLLVEARRRIAESLGLPESLWGHDVDATVLKYVRGWDAEETSELNVVESS
jgi:IclR family KDG regulon transcriptional repressor